MILIDIYCMETGRTYEFKADETAYGKDVCDQIVEMIAHSEKLQRQETDVPYFLCARELGIVLDPAKTLFENGVRPGDQLLLA